MKFSGIAFWIAVSDAGYEGSFSIYFTDDADDAGASQIDLTLIEA